MITINNPIQTLLSFFIISYFNFGIHFVEFFSTRVYPVIFIQNEIKSYFSISGLVSGLIQEVELNYSTQDYQINTKQ